MQQNGRDLQKHLISNPNLSLTFRFILIIPRSFGMWSMYIAQFKTIVLKAKSAISYNHWDPVSFSKRFLASYPKIDFLLPDSAIAWIRGIAWIVLVEPRLCSKIEAERADVDVVKVEYVIVGAVVGFSVAIEVWVAGIVLVEAGLRTKSKTPGAATEISN